MKIGRRHPILQWIGWWQDSHWRADVAVALIVGAVEIVGTHFAGQNQPDHRALDAVAFALLAAGAAALVFRRQYPGWVLIFVNGITLLYLLLDYPKGPIFLTTIIAFITAVMQGRRLIAWAVLAAEFVLFPWLPYFLGNEPAPTSTALLVIAGWLLVLATVTELAHLRQQRIMRTRAEEARRRAGEERLRIARELHDVLGHHISLISVQANVALHLMDKQPEQARVALSVIKDAGRDALRELRSVLDVLRQVNEEPPRSPSPGLASLSDLISRASEAGLQVHTEVSGDLKRLPASVDLAAFRIVQEALTNVMRHSGRTTSSVHVSCNEQELTLQIDNDAGKAGKEGSRDGIGLGQGILGMQERATALGGVVEAGPRPDGGFRVFARLPLDGSPLTTPGAGE
ncbi:MAG TPA: histidine kinase [Anaerolineales bacterium]|nr:histidine kinase [Anaerolineales bacterium]